MSETRKLYQDLEPGETLQIGDQRMSKHPSASRWHTITSTYSSLEIGKEPCNDRFHYRRPVDAVSREEYDQLRQQLADERTEHARTIYGRDTLRGELGRARDRIEAMTKVAIQLQSQPNLQRVTPEIIAELEQRQAWIVLFQHKENKNCRYAVVKYDKFGKGWWGVPGGQENLLDWHWFIEPSAIPEVT